MEYLIPTENTVRLHYAQKWRNRSSLIGMF